MATELTDLMAKLTTYLWERTKQVTTTATIEAKKAEFLARNTIDCKNQALGDRMDQGDDTDKITNMMDKRITANLATKKGKEREKEKVMRKKSLGGIGTQTPTLVKNGQSTKAERETQNVHSRSTSARNSENISAGRGGGRTPRGRTPKRSSAYYERHDEMEYYQDDKAYYNRGQNTSRSRPRYKCDDQYNDDESYYEDPPPRPILRRNCVQFEDKEDYFVDRPPLAKGKGTWKGQCKRPRPRPRPRPSPGRPRKSRRTTLTRQRQRWKRQIRWKDNILKHAMDIAEKKTENYKK